MAQRTFNYKGMLAGQLEVAGNINGQIGDLQAEASDLAGEISSLEGQLAGLEGSHNPPEVDNSGAIASCKAAIANKQARASAISGQISKLSASLAQTSAIINDLIVQISAIDGSSSKIFSELNKEISDYIKSLINLNDTFNNPLLEKALISTTSIPAVLGFINRNIENDKGFADYIKSVAMAGVSSINAIIQGIKIALNSGRLDKKSISASAMAISPAAIGAGGSKNMSANDIKSFGESIPDVGEFDDILKFVIFLVAAGVGIFTGEKISTGIEVDLKSFENARAGLKTFLSEGGINISDSYGYIVESDIFGPLRDLWRKLSEGINWDSIKKDIDKILENLDRDPQDLADELTGNRESGSSGGDPDGDPDGDGDNPSSNNSSENTNIPYKKDGGYNSQADSIGDHGQKHAYNPDTVSTKINLNMERI